VETYTAKELTDTILWEEASRDFCELETSNFHQATRAVLTGFRDYLLSYGVWVTRDYTLISANVKAALSYNEYRLWIVEEIAAYRNATFWKLAIDLTFILDISD